MLAIIGGTGLYQLEGLEVTDVTQTVTRDTTAMCLAMTTSAPCTDISKSCVNWTCRQGVGGLASHCIARFRPI